MNDVLIGVATPQANATVEIEFGQYFSAPAQPVFTRLTSAASSYSTRLVEYLEQLPKALASFGGMPLRAMAFACTGSSYLLGTEREDEIRDQAEREYRVQVITATQAIRRELEGRGARRIAMVAPYPQELCDAAVDYWAMLGFDIVALHRIAIGDDTRDIYDISASAVVEATDSLGNSDADVILLSGTGMPTLQALCDATTPMLSSNLCLATELLRRTHLWPPAEAANVRQLLRGD